MPADYLLILAAFLFSVGLVIIITKKNTVMMLMGLELMLNASNINLVVFNKIHADTINGQMFALFVIVVAVAESAVGLAIILQTYRYFKSSQPDNFNELKG